MKQLARLFRRGQLNVWKKSVKKILKNPGEYECEDGAEKGSNSTIGKSNLAAFVHRGQKNSGKPDTVPAWKAKAGYVERVRRN